LLQLTQLSPAEFCDFLTREGIRRFFLVWDEKEAKIRVSHPALAPLAEWLEADRRDFDRHEGIFGAVGPETGVLFLAALHRTCRGQGQGGVRFWRYDTIEDFLRDGLRLARGMTHKNALAGLWWGGGKGLLARATGKAEDPSVRRLVFEEYGEFITALQGAYITAEDVGTKPADIAAIHTRTRFVTCIPPAIGGSGNPSGPTALGVVRGMEAALAFLGRGDLRGKSVAVQGLGHVGELLIGYLEQRGIGRIVGSDIDPDRVARIGERFAGLELDLRVVERGDPSVLFEPADIVAPCATGGILGPETIPHLQSPIVCGAANNQLEDPERDGAALQERGILYMPDFLINRMGIVHCADEQFGYVEGDPKLEMHLGNTWENSVYNLSLAILAESKQTGRTPAQVALDRAEKRSFDLHPIWGDRASRIVRSLAESGRYLET
jgi:glutamate dehydrogenase/leucine dehydrogenase